MDVAHRWHSPSKYDVWGYWHLGRTLRNQTSCAVKTHDVLICTCCVLSFFLDKFKIFAVMHSVFCALRAFSTVFLCSTAFGFCATITCSEQYKNPLADHREVLLGLDIWTSILWKNISLKYSGNIKPYMPCSLIILYLSAGLLTEYMLFTCA